ncbi:MAG: hypothetical protein NZ911_06170 [Sulfolobales archaeon]|nr:hypothetical protein [Sulfolobales archaeon]
MWKCNCAICRALVHPIIRRASVVSHVESAVVAEQAEGLPKELELGGEATGPSQPTPSPPQPAQMVGQQSPEAVQQGQQPPVVEVKIPQELIDRINQLDAELSSLKKEMTSLSDTFKSAVIEFKEAIAEISSPFNMLRSADHRNGNGNGKNGNGRKLSLDSGTYSSITPTSFLELLRIIYSMLGKMSKEQALILIDGYVKVGLVNSEVGKALMGVVELADNMRRSGLSLEDQLPYLYGIISALNVKDHLLSEYVLKELMKRGGIN